MEATRLGISNMNFLIADVISSFLSGTMITFSQGGQQKSNLSSFQCLAPGLCGLNSLTGTAFELLPPIWGCSLGCSVLQVVQ